MKRACCQNGAMGWACSVLERFNGDVDDERPLDEKVFGPDRPRQGRNAMVSSDLLSISTDSSMSWVFSTNVGSS